METCPKCHTNMSINPHVILTSMPPKPAYYCPTCEPLAVISSDIGNATMMKTAEVADLTLGEGVMLTTCDIEFESNGARYRLSPREDLTPFELYQIDRWKEALKLNAGRARIGEQLHRYAKELGIIRHFDYL